MYLLNKMLDAMIEGLIFNMDYKINIAGLDRFLPLCRVNDDLYIGAFVMFGDVEITMKASSELLKGLRNLMLSSQLNQRESRLHMKCQGFQVSLML